MNQWWNWSPKQGTEKLGFAVVGIGRFGSAVCRELMNNGVDVLAVDASEKANPVHKVNVPTHGLLPKNNKRVVLEKLEMLNENLVDQELLKKGEEILL